LLLSSVRVERTSVIWSISSLPIPCVTMAVIILLVLILVFLLFCCYLFKFLCLKFLAFYLLRIEIAVHLLNVYRGNYLSEGLINLYILLALECH
jgi:hypothetical protein